MEFLLVSHALWKRRIPLAIGLVVAIGVLVGLGGTKLTTSTSAVAWTRVALDTPTSQLVDSAPDGADTLTWRASLLMHTLATDDSQEDVARRLGLRPDQVAVVDGTFARPLRPASMPTRAADAAGIIGAPYIVTVAISDYSLPMIAVEAAAPDVAGAKKLADAVVAVLETRASRGGTFQSPIESGASDELQAFDVAPVAPVRVKTVSETTPPMKAIGASLFILCAWWSAVLVLPLLRRVIGRRAALPA